MKREKIYFWEVIFIITGIITTMSYQMIFNQGGGDSKTMFPATAKYIGYFLAILLPKNSNQSNNKSKKKIPHVKVFLSSVFEFSSHVLGFIGLSYVGSGMYQVVYSTVVIFTAIMGRLLLNRYLRFNQWIGIVVVSIGLLFTSLPASYFDLNSYSFLNLNDKLFHSTVDPLRDDNYDLYYTYPLNFWDSLLGTSLVLTSTILISFNYIINDSIMKEDHSPVTIQTYSGIYTVSFCIIYSIFYTIPHIEETFYQPIKQSNGNLTTIILLYLFVTFNSFFHNFAFYSVIGEVGAITFGLLQAVRAVGVFFGSAIFFCSTQEFQCLTLPKIISTILVTLGILAFSYQRNSNNIVHLIYHWIIGTKGKISTDEERQIKLKTQEDV